MSDIQSWDDLASLDSYETENNLLIIDGNNLAYRWIKRHNYNDYSEDFIGTVKSLAKSYGAVRTICCFDFGKSYYRREILDSYKSTRPKPETEEEQKKYDEFFDCLNRTIEQLPMESYKFRGVEADDILAYLTLNLKSKYNHVWMVSSDQDLYQLVDENVSIFNIYSRREITEDYLLEEFGVTPSEELLAKIIRGDKGDDIIGIEGIGDKRSRDLARKYGTFDALLKALPLKGKAKYIQNLNAGKEKLILNRNLISLERHHLDALLSGKDGEDVLKELERAVNHR